MPHQASILFLGQFSLEHLILGPLLLNCLFQPKYLCTQLQDLVLLRLGDGQKGKWEDEGKGTPLAMAPSLTVTFLYFWSDFPFLPPPLPQNRE